jgi:hypothetical protein
LVWYSASLSAWWISFPLGAVPFGLTLTYVLLFKQGKPPGYDRDLFELWITGRGFAFNAGDQITARKRK